MQIRSVAPMIGTRVDPGAGRREGSLALLDLNQTGRLGTSYLTSCSARASPDLNEL